MLELHTRNHAQLGGWLHLAQHCHICWPCCFPDMMAPRWQNTPEAGNEMVTLSLIAMAMVSSCPDPLYCWACMACLWMTWMVSSCAIWCSSAGPVWPASSGPLCPVASPSVYVPWALHLADLCTLDLAIDIIGFLPLVRLGQSGLRHCGRNCPTLVEGSVGPLNPHWTL